MSQAARMQDGALDALALIEGLLDENPTNWNAVMDATLHDRAALLYGLTDLSRSLLLALSAAMGEHWRETAARQRHVILSREAAS